MAPHHTRDRSGAVADMPEVVVVEVTVRPDPRAHLVPGRIGGMTGAIRRPVATAAAVMLLVAAVAALWLSGDESGQPQRKALTSDRGPTGVAAAYGYPLGCLSVTFLATDRNYARADFNHRSSCGRYTGYPTAIFHYHAGAWRPVLDAIAFVCPVDWLPPDVQTGLDVCVPASGQRHVASR